jgi:CrcB protein
MLTKLFWLGIAGAAGTVTRYGLAGLVQRVSDGAFPWGTLAVNILGCFAAGLFWMISERFVSISAEFRAIILIGFVGAFTTFSTFMLETSHLARDAEWLFALKNILLNNAAGAMALLLGLWLGRAIRGGA